MSEENPDVIETFNFEKICRLCLLEKSSLLRIFGKRKKTKSSTTPLPIRIMSCASLEVYPGDGLPPKICAKCLWNVNQAYSFREQCDAANTRLQKYLHQVKNSSLPSSSQTQDNLEVEAQEAIPLEYLDAQMTISETSSSLQIKKESDLNIKSEPEAVEEQHHQQQQNQEQQQEETKEKQEQDDEDDKPISQLISFVDDNIDDSCDVENEPDRVVTFLENIPETKVEESYSDAMEMKEQKDTKPKPRRVSDSELKKDPTYNSHKKFLVLGSEYNKIKIKMKRVAIKQENTPKIKVIKIKKEKPMEDFHESNLEMFHQKPRRKYAPREKNLISNNSNAIIEQDGSKSKFRACTHCGKVVLGKNMGIHVKIHVGNKSHLCDICGKSFLYKKTLETHKRVHSGERPCVCKICGKTFRSSSRLSDHMSTHTGRKPFICEICAVAFRIKGHLKKHLRVHSGEKPYICTFCEKAFSDAWNMKCHLRIHTGEKPPHSCPVCGQCFLRRNKMEEHCKVTHGEQYVLPRRQYIIQRLKNDLVDNNEQLRQITEREKEEQLRQETERQLLQSHLERSELVERFSDAHLPISVHMPLPLPVPAFPGNIPGIFGLQ